MTIASNDVDQLRRELEELRLQVCEAQEALEAIRSGEVDALVVYGEEGEQIYTLQGAEHPYRVMVENINEGAATMSGDGVVLYANPQLARLLKAPPETILGYPFRFFVASGERSLFEALLELGGRMSGRAEITLKSMEGSTLPALISVSPLQDPDLAGVCMVVTDLSDQKRNSELLAAERMANSIIAQAAEAIVVCDRTGKIIRASQSAYSLARSNPLYQPFREVFPLRYEEVEGRNSHFSLEAILGGAQIRAVPVSLELTSPDGEGKWKAHLLVSAAPLSGVQGEMLGCIVSMTDVSERRRVGQEPEEIIRIALDGLGEFLGLDLCFLDEVSHEHDLIVVHSEYRRRGNPVVGRYKLSAF
jgi:PAS domain S-box-containing protein